jgi:hypothetical protein
MLPYLNSIGVKPRFRWEMQADLHARRGGVNQLRQWWRFGNGNRGLGRKFQCSYHIFSRPRVCLPFSVIIAVKCLPCLLVKLPRQARQWLGRWGSKLLQEIAGLPDSKVSRDQVLGHAIARRRRRLRPVIPVFKPVKRTAQSLSCLGHAVRREPLALI